MSAVVEIRAMLQCERPQCSCHSPRGNVHCPAHDDEHPSLRVRSKNGRPALRCFAGCSRERIIRALQDRGFWPADETPASQRAGKSVAAVTPLHKSADTATGGPIVPALPSGGVVKEPRGLTLEDLAQAKHLPVELLTRLGCHTRVRNGIPRVEIPYVNEHGDIAAVRYRHSLEGDRRFSWRRGDHPILYGLPRLQAVRQAGWVLLVEGESDYWTATHHGVPALGIPGKGTWRGEWAPLLEGMEVVLWQEPDAEDLIERVSRDVPGLRVIASPPFKDLSEAYLAGEAVPDLVGRLRSGAISAAQVSHDRHDDRVARLRRAAAPVLDAEEDPILLLERAIRAGGYGGDPRQPMLIYIAATSRLLVTRPGTMPVHILLLGPAGAGKSYTLSTVLRLLPPSAHHTIEAGSPRALIYDTADLRNRVLVFGEADSLPAGEDNPAASAVRALLQDNRLRYDVTVRHPETGDFCVRHIDRPGPTVLITTAVRRLGDQLDTRLFTVVVADDPAHLREVLLARAKIELGGVTPPDEGIIAFQDYLQANAPFDVVVSFVELLADALGRSPAAPPRLARDFEKILSLIKAVAVLRHVRRDRDSAGRIVASIEDYRTVYSLIGDIYTASVTGADEKVRATVLAVKELKEDRVTPVTVTAVAERLGISKMSASRRVRAALKGGYLVNRTDRKNAFDLEEGEPLPPAVGLPSPETLAAAATVPSATVPSAAAPVGEGPDVPTTEARNGVTASTGGLASSQAVTPCPWCQGSWFWRSLGGQLVCAVCHPPAAPDIILEWVGEERGRRDSGT